EDGNGEPGGDRAREQVRGEVNGEGQEREPAQMRSARAGRGEDQEGQKEVRPRERPVDQPDRGNAEKRGMRRRHRPVPPAGGDGRGFDGPSDRAEKEAGPGEGGENTRPRVPFAGRAPVRILRPGGRARGGGAEGDSSSPREVEE